MVKLKFIVVSPTLFPSNLRGPLLFEQSWVNGWKVWNGRRVSSGVDVCVGGNA